MDLKGIGTGSGVNGLVAAGGAAIALVAAGIYFSTQEMTRLSEEDVSDVTTSVAPSVVETATLPDDMPKDLPANATTPKLEDTVQEEAVAVESVPEPTVPEVAEAAPEAQSIPAPQIDEVRVETSGAIVIAGRADPGARVDVLVDDEVVATVDADRSGAFATLSTLSASDDARRLSLRTGEGEEAIASEEEIILAPVPAADAPPSATSEETEPAPAPDPVVTAAREEPEAPSEDVATSAQDTPAAESPVTEVETAETTPEEPAQADTFDAATADEETAPAPEADSGTQVAVLRSDESGVTVLSNQPPATSVELDTIGYNDAGEVQLSGRAETGSVEIRAYLNNRAVARLPVDSEGNWRGDVPEIDTGIYTLRVDAVDAEGDVVSRIETPFKREEPAVLAAAIAGPEGPARAVTVQAGDTLWAIARDRYGEGLLYVQVFDANRDSIRDPDLIYPGQVFDLPTE